MKRALVVYESMFGNTEEIARAVAEGLGTRLEVAVVEVSEAPAEVGDDVAIIVAGGPTHAFSMTRENTREDAIRQGARKGHAEIGLREWLSALPEHPRTQQQFVTFDTRARQVRHLPGSAAKSAGRLARQHGYPRFAGSESFYVEDVAGPLLDGETARATQWGEVLANRLMEAS